MRVAGKGMPHRRSSEHLSAMAETFVGPLLLHEPEHEDLDSQ
jgi:hypothetical protein